MYQTVRFASLVAAAALTACASQAPQPYSDVFNAVNRTNSYQNYAAKDYRPMAAGESGNCARFAATYQQQLAQRGISSEIGVCKLRNGPWHAFTMTPDGYVLDVRQRWVGRWEDVGCQMVGG